MTDERFRRLDREARGSLPWISERLRRDEMCTWPDAYCYCAGTDLRWKPRIALAAYCGHADARLALGFCCDFHYMNSHIFAFSAPCGGRPFGVSEIKWFTSGLRRWGPWIQVRASLVAGKMVPSDDTDCADALAAARQWLEDPSEANANACYIYAEDITLPTWAMMPAYIVYHYSRVDNTSAGILHAADRVTNVLEAVKRDLIEWSINGR